MIYLTGLTLALGLIVAIGSQNAWVLSMSLRGQRPWPIALVCMSVDVVLMAIGVVAFARIQAWLPGLVPWFTAMAVLLLVVLAWQAGRRAIRGQSGLTANLEQPTLGLRQAVLAALAMSLLNPHVYLDTVVLLGSLAAASQQPWLFWSGSASASILWFSALAAAGKPLSRWLSSPRRWRLFDTLMALFMAWMAVVMAFKV
ncbi:MAG: LysE family transporter [Reinekea forsetii]|jgi:L-lysine exporter family protein LysE/ArgO|uniref:Lysine transporter LysE n=1 Tax=Reinekea forsetii TaxID=1336806 RepID=A0A2K8KME5_9GAMM|nr:MULTISPECIES: LysE family transporter [Reinekea]ATX76018.1 lysine transporter LysE [Reinekea forsetii]MDB9894436.1 LysE family transporter [Reinekea forsetii]MDO7641279.1 LysE family transporter [Reinekea forsetii]MDO7643517.1 LysE family transporter [Reinekea forsetii]MDO7673401.1 LysE family transporter [Reinekea forsetii]